MADTRISALSAAAVLDGTEVLPVVQLQSTKRATVQQVADYATSALDIAVEVLSAIVSNQNSAIAENSAKLTSVNDALSNAISVLSQAHTSLVNRVSANSGTGGAGSVTSNELSVAVAAESAGRTSADAALAQAISVLSADVVSIKDRLSSLSSQVSSISAQMTSADNAISQAVSLVSVAAAAASNAASNALSVANAASNAASIVSAAQAVTSADLTSAKNRLSALSAQVTSADNAISNAVSIVSQAVSIVSVAAAAASNAASNALSVANAASNAASIVSAAQGVTSADLTSVKNRFSGLSSQVTSADNAISNAVSIVSVATANAISMANAISQRLSALVLDSILNVSAPSPTSSQVLKYNSAAGFQYDETQVKSAMRKDGPFKGCAEYIFRKKENKTYHYTHQYADDLVASIKNAKMIIAPFPHLVIEDFLPTQMFDAIMEYISSGVAYKELHKRGTTGYPERFFCETPDSISWMHDGILRMTLDEKFGIPSSVKDEILLLRDKPGYKIAPHTDSPAKAVTMLVYLDAGNHGTTLYAPKKKGFADPNGLHWKEKDFQAVKTIAAKPNSALIFARTNTSFHGVKEFKGPGERNILLYDSKR